jgi:hypothetical protein
LQQDGKNHAVLRLLRPQKHFLPIRGRYPPAYIRSATQTPFIAGPLGVIVSHKLTTMKKMTYLFLILAINIQIVHSQDTKLILKILPENSWTADKLIFHCTAHNLSRNTFKLIPFLGDCGDKYYSIFWKIVIHKDNIEYDYDPDRVVIHGDSPLIKIHPHSKYDFSFCIDFSKLVCVDSYKQKKIQSDTILFKSNKNLNSDYGTYLIQLEYIPLLKIKNQAGHLVSDQVTVFYNK